MYLQLILSIFILLGSVNSYAKPAIDDLQVRWRTVLGININPHIKKETPIIKPKNTWTKVLELNLLNENFEVYKDCVLYKVPETKGTGILKIFFNKTAKTCESQAFEPGDIEVKGIFNFGFNSYKDKLSFIIDDKTYLFKFPNLNSENKDLLLGKKIKDVSIQKLKEGDICRDFTDSCQPIQKANCSLCPAGSVDAIYTDCPGMYRKYCAPNSCGGKGEYACARGMVSTKYSGDFCIPDSPVGFCRKGLRVICRNSELICN